MLVLKQPRINSVSVREKRGIELGYRAELCLGCKLAAANGRNSTGLQLLSRIV